MEDKLISVVVPIYNVEKYLRQCVDSILQQTYKNLEVILVDDGSPDRCPEICDEYAKKDSRVKVIHKPNGGLGSAYNTGIQNARGDYIGLVESDDWIEPDMYQNLLESALKFDSDVVKCNFYNYNSFAKVKRKENGLGSVYEWSKLAPDDRSFSITEYPSLMIPHVSIWAALYKKSLIKDIPFVETKSATYQDYPFMMEVFFAADKISVVHKPLLNYRQENGNNSSSVRTDNRLIIIAENGLKTYNVLQNHPKFELCLEEFVQSIIATNYYFYSCIDERYKREYFEKIRETFAFMSKYPQLRYKYATSLQREFVVAVLNNDFEKVNLIFSTPKVKKYLWGIIRKEKTRESKKLFLFGKLICSKIKKN